MTDQNWHVSLKPEILDFFQFFSNRFRDGDIQKVSDLYDEPAVIIRPDRTEILSSREDLTREARDVRQLYIDHDLKCILPDIRDIQCHDPGGLIMADIEWHLINTDGRRLVALQTTYGLRRRDGKLRVAVHIAHSEGFVRETLATTGKIPDMGEMA